MQEPSSRAISTHRLERALAITGTVLCLVISAGVWWGLRVQQSLWPLPDLYLLEMLAASGLATWGIWVNGTRPASQYLVLTWVAIGAILGFVILATFSIGFFYLPVVVLLISAAILADRRVPGRTGQARLGSTFFIHMGACIAAAGAQAALMLAVIRVMYP